MATNPVDRAVPALSQQAAPATQAPPKRAAFSFSALAAKSVKQAANLPSINQTDSVQQASENRQAIPAPAREALLPAVAQTAERAAPPATAQVAPDLAVDSSPAIPPQAASPAVAADTPPAVPKFSFGSAGRSSVLDQAQTVARVTAPDTIVGVLADLKMYGDWGHGKVLDNETGRKISVKGSALSGLQVGARYRLSGKRSKHEKFGDQFDVTHVEPDMESLDALISHIQRNYRNIGFSTASKVAQFHREAGTLEHLKEQLVHNPSAVDFSRFTDRPVTLLDDEDSQSRRVKDSLSIRFGGLGIARNVLNDLASWLIGKAQEVMSSKAEGNGRDLVSVSNAVLDENPYRPMEDVERYGFGTADIMARKAGIATDDPRRIAAIVTYALRQGSENGGHVFLNAPQFYEAILRVDPSLKPVQAIELAIEQGAPIVIDGNFGQERFYDKKLRRSESLIVNNLAARMTTPADPLCDLEAEDLDQAILDAVERIKEASGKPGFELDESQFSAVRGILSSPTSVHTLIGGPGCGKTTIMEVVMEVLTDVDHDGRSRRRRTEFVAPTGKAAKVLTGRVKKWGQPRTLHSALEFRGAGFERDASNPLDADFVVGDEQSMLGTPLGGAFLDAIPIRSHMLFLGDLGQLAAIEPGQPLKAILQIEAFDHHQLTTTHRNKGAILKLVNMVENGQWPSADLMKKFLTEGDIEYVDKLPTATPAAISQLAIEVKEAAAQFGGLEHVAVICPKRRGTATQPDWNVTYLNHALRDVLNPDPDSIKKIAGSSYRVNDRIIITKNMDVPEAGDLSAPSESAGLDFQRLARDTSTRLRRSGVPVFDEHGEEVGADFGIDEEDEHDDEVPVINGDTGWLRQVEYGYEDGVKQPKWYVLQLDDGRNVKFPASESDSLNLAYAITVHASQGSEYEKTFCVVTDGLPGFMHRATVKTAISRAKKQLKIIGDNGTIAKIVARDVPGRNCAIVERALQEAASDMDVDVPEAQAPRPLARERSAA